MAASSSFGKDISCTSGLRTGRFAMGARLVAEALYRRLITPRGMLRGGEDEANYGLDICGLIGSSTSASDEAALPGRIRVELMKDERVESVEVSVVSSVSGPTTSYTITVEAQTAEGPFMLTVAASSVTVELLGIKEGS